MAERREERKGITEECGGKRERNGTNRESAKKNEMEKYAKDRENRIKNEVVGNGRGAREKKSEEKREERNHTHTHKKNEMGTNTRAHNTHTQTNIYLKKKKKSPKNADANYC